MKDGLIKKLHSINKMVVLILSNQQNFLLSMKTIFDRCSKKSIILDTNEYKDLNLDDEPDIVILHLNLESEIFKYISQFTKKYPNSEIIVVGKPPSQEVMLKLLELGIKGYFKEEIELNRFENYIHEVAASHEQHKNLLELHLRIHDLLDILGSMIIMTDGEEIKYANKSFLEFVSIQNQEDFTEKYSYIFDLNALIVKINDKIIKDGDNWLEVLKQVPQKFSVSYLHDIHENSSTAFITTIAELPCYKDNYVVSFTDITKLEEDKFMLKKELDTFAELKFLIDEKIESLRRKEQLILQQSKMISMGEMLNNIIHQWKQPLTAISLMLNNLDDAREYGDINNEMIENTIKKCLSQIEYMSTTINDFKGFLSPSKRKSIFSLKSAIEQTVSLVSNYFQNKLIKIEFELLTEQKIDAYGYPNEFKQVVLNILNNAKDAILDRMQKEASQTFFGLIKIELKIDKKYAVVSILDNGGGIKEEHLPHIFEQYFTTKDESGTGIGLYMSKIIIETNMEGRLIASNYKDGAKFDIYVPIANVDS